MEKELYIVGFSRGAAHFSFKALLTPEEYGVEWNQFVGLMAAVNDGKELISRKLDAISQGEVTR